MNLTEKIIKGITEIEYEINPELLKDQPDGKPKQPGEVAGGVSMQELSFVLDELDWQIVGQNFADLVTVVLKHPEIADVELTFQYTPDDMMLTKEFRVDGSKAHGSFTMPVDLDRIRKITYGWLKGEDLGPDATIEQPGDIKGIGDYQLELEADGWTRGRTKDSTINKGGKSRQGFSTMFMHPDTADGLRLFYDEDGTVIHVFIIHPVTGSTSIHPTIGSVLDASAGLVAQP